MDEFIKELQVTDATWHRCLNQYGSKRNAEAAKRTKEPEKEKSRFKKLLANRVIHVHGLIDCFVDVEVQIHIALYGQSQAVGATRRSLLLLAPPKAHS